ncbi:MAG: PASTA domain-containing protein, partial [Erysipelotrichaceae bacterium]|nr:PASTA domain-containing protein [Erysipelotrichaceae bacterium]
QEFLNEGVHIEIEYEYSNAADTNPGIILEQRHLKPGDRIDPDSEESIYFIVSQYPTIVIPEDIVGMNVDDAKDQLNELGIAVVTRKMDSGMGSGVVVMTEPAAGTTYTQEGSDSVVTLYYD